MNLLWNDNQKAEWELVPTFCKKGTYVSFSCDFREYPDLKNEIRKDFVFSARFYAVTLHAFTLELFVKRPEVRSYSTPSARLIKVFIFSEGRPGKRVQSTPFFFSGGKIYAATMGKRKPVFIMQQDEVL